MFAAGVMVHNFSHSTHKEGVVNLYESEVNIVYIVSSRIAGDNNETLSRRRGGERWKKMRKEGKVGEKQQGGGEGEGEERNEGEERK